LPGHISLIRAFELGNDALPRINLVIAANNPIIDQVEWLKIFPKCKVEHHAEQLSISGYTPAAVDLFMQVKATVRSVFSGKNIGEIRPEPNTSPLLVAASTSLPAVRERKAAKAPAELSAIIPPVMPEEESVIIRWTAGLFQSTNKNCSIKRVEHPLFSRNHFVMFQIPRKCFPNDAIYEAVKNKVEEGRLASKKEGHQGGQFRVEAARDETKKHRPWFIANMRYKGLGTVLGDIRLFAEHQLSLDGKNHLYIYKGLNLHAH
jgi:hypothetical protein